MLADHSKKFWISDFSAAPFDGFNRVATEGRQQPPMCHLDRGPNGPEWRDLWNEKTARFAQNPQIPPLVRFAPSVGLTCGARQRKQERLENFGFRIYDPRVPPDFGFGTCHGVVQRTKRNFDYVGGIWPSRLPAVSGCPLQEEGLSPAEVIICCTRFSRTGTSS